MLRLVALSLSVLALTACATSGHSPSALILGGAGERLDGVIDQLADNDLIKVVVADADRTLAWIDAERAAHPEAWDPIKTELASACPRAAKAAAADFHEKLVALKGALAGLADDRQPDAAGNQGALIYTLTRLRYGDRESLKERAEKLRGDIDRRLDLLVTGCGHLFPLKELANLAKLATKLGLKAQFPMLPSNRLP